MTKKREQSLDLENLNLHPLKHQLTFNQIKN
jgi:hypothetical protein